MKETELHSGTKKHPHESESEIICFVKFGKKEYMNELANGNMFFLNALKYREIEEKLLIKGQGDRLEGGTMIYARNITMVDNETQETVMTGIEESIAMYFEPADPLPVFCLFACYKKDCTINSKGQVEFHLADEIKATIKEHFPEADSAAVIMKPELFISNIESALKTHCVAEKVQYFNKYGFDSENGRVNDLQYVKYLTQDNPPQEVIGAKVYSFNVNHVYRSLLCKDVFFKNEQEFRIILPEEMTYAGTIYPVNFDTAINVVGLDAIIK